MPEWTSQVRRGILEYCVLSLIGSKPTYGYELVTTLNRWEALAVTEGTLYPILRRLVNEKLLESFWQESDSGPPRKYYRLTSQGQQLAEKMAQDWSMIVQAVHQIEKLKAENNDEPNGKILFE
ncbi:PadR family transcriptional regulator [Paenibacillus pasadenensis]|uniref:PadR family transcriptional regulator n=1 Tax=Paenibacillus pasadenensis TaxID=217090 RepID=UPI00203EA0EF|nr:PadR family transcriptional regulator [Paenibacillus pasadenensis]MCM3748833.1 PadR family transcriptional regulator [Paenibacillus pasadenensis]